MFKDLMRQGEDVGVEWVSRLYLAGHIGRGHNGV